VHLNDMIMLL